MSNSVSAQNLVVIDTIKEGIAIGVKNIGSILVNVILWILTIWIPYLNVGTTIGLTAGIVSKASRGEVIPMTEIFDPKYRKYMGEYFLVSGLVSLGIWTGAVFFIIPGIVIALAWSLAILLVIDKGKNPMEAISLSNSCTYGNKWKMTGIYFLVGLAYIILIAIFGLIPTLGVLLIFAASVLYIFINIGLQASIYKQLTEGI
ncbi:MAG: hypothetical protein FWC36_03595 [Spirochaetes bacterium]|nr:hypothetical protein [Spirochaetota bacterium]